MPGVGPKIYMVRHGRAAAGWDTDPDPGLDDLGQQQAEQVAASLADNGPLPIVASPMQRCRETAAPLAEIWGCKVRIEPRVSEIIAPTEDLAERTNWLRSLMAERWPAAGQECDVWRRGVTEALSGCEEDTVIFSHFVAINVAMGAALNDDRVLIGQPDYCSVTVFENNTGQLKLVKHGREAETKIR